MESHLNAKVAKFSSRCISRSVPFLGVFLLTMQLAAQNQIIRGPADQTQLATGSQQIAAAPSAPPLPEISAPLPAQKDANLSSPKGIPFLALAAGQDSSQSSSQNAPATVPPTQTTVPRKKAAHHGLGVALAVIGTAALVSGVALYVGEQHAYCNSSSSGCNEAKDFGLALMPVGAGVAVTGFYLQFHR
jgi:hypothetical protein